ncbi:hydroxyacid dehydrogenase [Myceligenerans salitolerans]|uniref:hydroxyacid dehydrogenase n=1 Tax=Myceligenerans salitolerans TaxID=1230528 RepID=UPI0027DDA951|nr:hydroxyacid dehydrogenase [Myceligenerans salitolerans]
MNRPEVLLAMSHATYRAQFGAAERARLAELAALGEPVQVASLDEPGARERLAGVEVLLTSWGAPRLTADVLAAAPRLRAVIHCAGTVKPVVSDGVWERDLLVTNAVDANAVPVAEFTFAAIVMAGKRAPFLAARARTARDDWSVDGIGDLSNRGRTIGIVGFSRTGRRVVERLAALDVREVLVSDPYADRDEVKAAGARLAGLDEVLTTSDITSLHAPALPSTRHLIGARELALMPDHATLINTARGMVVDTSALEAECRTGRLFAILDVTDPEPLPADSVLYDLPNVMITPHIAGSLGTETRRMTAAALDELELYVRGEAPASPVTRESLETSA